MESIFSILVTTLVVATVSVPYSVYLSNAILDQTFKTSQTRFQTRHRRGLKLLENVGLSLKNTHCAQTVSSYSDDPGQHDEEAPPMVSGHAYPIRNVPPRERSARPRDLRPQPPRESEESMEVPDHSEANNNNNDMILEEDEEGVGPLIPPPQAFRGPPGHTHPLSQSVPQVCL